MRDIYQNEAAQKTRGDFEQKIEIVSLIPDIRYSCIGISGNDCRRFLQNLTTNDIYSLDSLNANANINSGEKIALFASQHSIFASPQGRVLYHVFIHLNPFRNANLSLKEISDDSDGCSEMLSKLANVDFIIDVYHEYKSDLINYLNKFKLGSKIEIVDLSSVLSSGFAEIIRCDECRDEIGIIDGIGDNDREDVENVNASICSTYYCGDHLFAISGGCYKYNNNDSRGKNSLEYRRILHVIPSINNCNLSRKIDFSGISDHDINDDINEYRSRCADKGIYLTQNSRELLKNSSSYLKYLYAHDLAFINDRIPIFGVDFLSDSYSPSDLNLDGIAVHYSKGCYIGQEAITRKHFLGSRRREMIVLDIDYNIGDIRDIADIGDIADIVGSDCFDYKSSNDDFEIKNKDLNKEKGNYNKLLSCRIQKNELYLFEEGESMEKVGVLLSLLPNKALAVVDCNNARLMQENSSNLRLSKYGDNFCIIRV